MKKLGLLTIILAILASISFGQTAAQIKKANKLIEQGNEYSDKKEFDKAIAAYTEVIKIRPNRPNAYNNRGIAKYEQAMDAYTKSEDNSQSVFESAVADFTQAIKLKPENLAEVFMSRGNAYWFLQNFDSDKFRPLAIADFTQVIELNPKSENAYIQRGDCYKRNLEYEKAIADYEKALAINPQFYDALVGYGVAIFSKDRNKADELFNRAINLRPDLPKAYYEVGEVFLMLGTENDYKQAYQFYTKAINADPKFAKAYLQRYATQRYGNPNPSNIREESLADLTKYVELKPKSYEGFYQRGLFYSFEFQKYAEAIADFDQSQKLFPSNPDVYSARADAYLALKNHQKAVEDWTKYLTLKKGFSDQKRVLMKRASAYIVIGNKAAAIQDYDTILAQTPRDLDIRETRNVAANGERSVPFQFSGNDQADYRKLLQEINSGKSIGKENVSWIKRYESKNNIKPN